MFAGARGGLLTHSLTLAHAAVSIPAGPNAAGRGRQHSAIADLSDRRLGGKGLHFA